jgi:hypothetical protein
MLRSAETINKRKLELDATYTIRNHTAALGRSATRLPTPQPLFHVDKGQHHSLVLGLGDKETLQADSRIRMTNSFTVVNDFLRDSNRPGFQKENEPLKSAFAVGTSIVRQFAKYILNLGSFILWLSRGGFSAGLVR